MNQQELEQMQSVLSIILQKDNENRKNAESQLNQIRITNPEKFVYYLVATIMSKNPTPNLPIRPG